MRVLVVEDERNLADAIARGLRKRGMAVDVAYDGGAGHEAAFVTRYDVVILDRDLPGVHGDKICADLVASGALTRVLMLTASGTVADRVEGLQLGADDYLPKPFAFDELVARVQALGRRATPAAPPVLEVGRPGARPGPAGGHPGRCAGRPDQQGVRRAGSELLKARGAVVSSEELLERVWDANTDPFTTIVRVTVMTLRKKLGDPPLIETVVGAGYRTVAERMTPPAAARLRPTLRLRLTLLNGVLLVGAGAILVLLAWLLVRDALRPTDELLPGTMVVLADGRHPRRRGSGSGELVDAASAGAAGQGPGGAAGDQRGRGRRGVRGGRPRAAPAAPGHRDRPAARRGDPRPADRLGPGADDEVAELAQTFDAMLDRIAAAFKAQKRFVANASHELRTPLAVMRTEIDVTLSDDEADVAEYRRMATVVRDASERANGLVDALLVLARSEAQAGRAARPQRTECDLAVGHRQRAVRDAPRGGADRPAGADLAGAGAGGRRPGPAGPAGRQPDRERGPLQPPARPDLGAHRQRRASGPGWWWATPASRSTRPTCRGCSSRSAAAAGNGPGRAARAWASPSSARSATRTAAPVAVVAQPGGGLEVTVTLPSADAPCPN